MMTGQIGQNDYLVCLFAFAMENDEGYYRWLKEPRFNSEGKSELALNKVNEFRKLTKTELNDLARVVVASP